MKRLVVILGLLCLPLAASAEMSFQFAPQSKTAATNEETQKVIIKVKGKDGEVETINHVMMKKTPLPLVDGKPPSPWRYAPIMAKARPFYQDWRSVPPLRPRVRPIMRMMATLPPQEELLFLHFGEGSMAIRLRSDLAPETVKRVKEWVAAGDFDGVAFTRVMDGLMMQTEAPKASKGQSEPLQAELSQVPYLRGTVGMMRKVDDVHSADGAFFITLAPSAFLSGQYSVWGDVVHGMEMLARVQRGHPQTGWVADNPTVIEKATLGSDMSQDEFAAIMQPPLAMGGP